MEKMTKTWLIIAAVLVVIGCLIFGGVMAMVKWDFTKLSTIKFENNEYEMNEKFSNIRVKTETTKLKLQNHKVLGGGQKNQQFYISKEIVGIM